MLNTLWPLSLALGRHRSMVMRKTFLMTVLMRKRTKRRRFLAVQIFVWHFGMAARCPTSWPGPRVEAITVKDLFWEHVFSHKISNKQYQQVCSMWKGLLATTMNRESIFANICLPSCRGRLFYIAMSMVVGWLFGVTNNFSSIYTVIAASVSLVKSPPLNSSSIVNSTPPSLPNIVSKNFPPNIYHQKFSSKYFPPFFIFHQKIPATNSPRKWSKVHTRHLHNLLGLVLFLFHFSYFYLNFSKLHFQLNPCSSISNKDLNLHSSLLIFIKRCPCS